MGIDDMFTEANFAGFMAEYTVKKENSRGSLLFEKSRDNTCSDDEASGSLSSLSDEFQEVAVPATPEPATVEAPGRLQQREKQIRIGKTTHGYQQYLLKIPKECRQLSDIQCMDTPPTSPRSLTMSKRNWDKELRKWRKFLHQFDEKEASEGTTETGEVTPMTTTPDIETVVPQQAIFHNQIAMQPMAYPMMPFMIQAGTAPATLAPGLSYAPAGSLGMPFLPVNSIHGLM
eukprot:TRINITY_DN30784_c0_g1_i1.p1 TRINITY_DN30784_c0_g1~~TRINITY_DN30784_c0_g1_i1.p1  ORF type:complete len:253 (+),score=67.77 TRINITY_DN30784_c0_g1_i1:67-759(+)